MSDSAVTLRRLTANDAALYREIRLQALIDAPHAFAGTLESEQDEPLDRFGKRLADSFVLGAFSGPRLVGIAGFYVQPKPKHTHKGMLWGMYVTPEARSMGIGRRLVEAIIDHARQRVELIQLLVVSDNTPARRLYASLGFAEYGLEHHATKYRGEYHDDVLMALSLVIG